MMMLTTQEVELLAQLLQRAGINVYEMMFANSVLDKLRVIALEQEAKAVLKPEPEPEEKP